jgi:hypothetical protein
MASAPKPWVSAFLCGVPSFSSCQTFDWTALRTWVFNGKNEKNERCAAALQGARTVACIALQKESLCPVCCVGFLWNRLAGRLQQCLRRRGFSLVEQLGGRPVELQVCEFVPWHGKAWQKGERWPGFLSHVWKSCRAMPAYETEGCLA